MQPGDREKGCSFRTCWFRLSVRVYVASRLGSIYILGGLCANFVSDLFVRPNHSSPGGESLSLGAPLNVGGAAHAAAIPSLVGVSEFSLGSVPSR